DEELSSVVDEAIGKLSRKDQTAVIMRFLTGKSHEEVGVALHLGPEAARKRVERALQKLRTILLSKGVDTATPSLGGFLANRCMEGAPPYIAASIIAADTSAPAASATGAAIAKGAIKM